MLFQTTQTLMSYSLFAPDFLLRLGNNRRLPYLSVISVTGVLLTRCHLPPALTSSDTPTWNSLRFMPHSFSLYRQTRVLHG